MKQHEWLTELFLLGKLDKDQYQKLLEKIILQNEMENLEIKKMIEGANYNPFKEEKICKNCAQWSDHAGTEECLVIGQQTPWDEFCTEWQGKR
jgi:hypothetical protein